MNKRTGGKEPAPKTNRHDDLNKRLKLLIGVLVLWLALFVLVMAEHARSWARLLPVVGVLWFVYGAYATWKFFNNTNQND